MVDIDERVVRMKFDSSDFETKTKSTFKILDTLKEKLSFKNHDSEKNLEEINDNIQKMADKAYTIIDRVIDKIRDDIANKLFNFLKENTIGQITSAWGKYADMTTSVATLRAQGYAMEDINEQLERLNYFTDETSYNFTSMVSEIGKFTSVGQKLEDATTAMMGIASWAALSGKNASEASRAMYQLSQAMGAGVMRMQDWKSIQTLNMATKEFKQNAIEAAIEAGTLKDNLDGTYTTLVGKKANNLKFTFNEFESKLTEGAWFTSDVMMKVYSKYSEAVDDLKALYDEGGTKIANGVEYHITTTADALDYVRAKNEELYSKFDNTQLKGQRTEINKLLSRWKNIEKVTDETVDNYATINDLTDKQKAEYRKNLETDYATYLKEYSEIFKTSEENAEEALDDWADYVSDFGLKAFGKAQEAKTFIEALESAKDAASTVWTGIFTKIFGNYDEAKSLWTDFANALYEIFVERLWNIDSVFEKWKEEGGRTTFFQGIYGFFGGIKQIIEGIREGWDSLFKGSGIERGAQRLLEISEGIRNSGARFYVFMMNLRETDFFKNMAQSLMNIINIFRALRDVILNIIKVFFPNGNAVTSILLKISEVLKNITGRLVPTQRAITNVVRILRGFISAIKLVVKIIKGFFEAILPAGVTLWDIITSIGGSILDFLGDIGDFIYGVDKATDSTNAFKAVFKGLLIILDKVVDVLGPVFKKVLSFLKPVIVQIKNLLLSLGSTIVKVFTGKSIDGVDTFGDKIKGTVQRIKDAWNSVDSLGKTFEKYKNGSGIGNALMMIGESFMNLARKIGRVILAVLGLESVLTEGKLHDSMVSFKDVLHNIFTVIEWVFTNIIFPVFGTLLAGIKNTLHEIGDAFRRGDLIAVLNYIKTIFSTIGSYGIVRLLLSINRLLGSGGILRIVRNLANLFKSISKYWNAKALNERASALQKLVITLGIVMGMLYLFSQLDDKELDRMWKPLKILGAVFVGLIVALTALSLVAQFTWKGLGMLTLAFLSLSLFVGLTIKTVKEFADTITNLRSSELYAAFASGGILMQIASILLGFLATMAFIGQRAGSGLMAVGVTFMGLGVMIYAFIKSLGDAVELYSKYKGKEGDIWKAFLLVAAGVAAVALVMKLLTSTMEDVSLFGKVKMKAVLTKSLGLALMTIVAVATFALVMIPALDALAQNMDKFQEYCQGMMLFLTMIFSIALAMKIITDSAGTKWHATLHTLASVVAFIFFTQYTIHAILPLLHELEKIKFEDVIGGVAAFSITILVISQALYKLALGVQHIFEGIAKINFKSIISMIVGVAGIFLTVSLMSMEIESGSISAGGILASLGILLGILTMLGGFILIINKSFKGATSEQVKGTTESIKMVMELFIAIASVIILGAAGSKWLSEGDSSNVITAFASITGALVLVITTVAIAFSSMVKSLKKSMSSGNNQEYILKSIETLMGMFLAISVSIIAMVGEIIALTAMGTNWESIIWFFGAITVSVMAILITVSATMTKMVKVIKDSFSTTVKADNIIKMLKTIMAIIITVFAGIAGVMLAINLTTSKNYEWMGGLNLVALGISFALIMTTIGETFDVLISAIQKSFSTTVKAENIVKVLDSIAVVIIAVFAGIAGVMVAINTTTSKNYEWMGAINLAVLAGAFWLIMTTLAHAFELLFKSIKENGIANSQQYKKYMAILITFGAVAAGVLLAIGGAMIMITKATEEQHWVKTAFNTIIMLGTLFVTFSTIGYAFEKIFNTVKKSGINNKEFAIVETVLGVMVVAILEMGYLVKALSEAELANSWDIVPIVLGVIAIIGTIAISVYALINTMKGITLEAQDVAILIATLGTMLLTLVMFGTGVLPQMKELNSSNVEAILAACSGLVAVLATIAITMGAFMIVSDKFLGSHAWRSVIISLVAFYGAFGAIALFGESLVDFFNGFKDISAENVGAALLAVGGLVAILTVFSIINGVLSKSGIMNLGTGLIISIIEMVAIFAILAGFKDSIVEFFDAFRAISSDDVGVALFAIGGLVAIVTLLGIFLEKLVKVTAGTGVAGIVGFIAMIFGIAFALNYAGPIIAGFFDMFTDIEDGAIWKGILAFGALAVITSLLGSAMSGFVVGVATFIASIIGLAIALELLASAIIALRVAFGDESYLDYMERMGQLSLKAITSKKGIDAHSPSKKFEQVGKWIDQGLALGIKKNMGLVTTAATTLGIVTDDSFKDELGIASPSKVFYENGRFIVRGLANGMNSKLGQLNNAGFDMGTNIAEGVKEGIGEEGIWKSIFGDEDPEAFFKKIADSGGKGITDALMDNEYEIPYDEWSDDAKRAYEEQKTYMLRRHAQEREDLLNSDITGRDLYIKDAAMSNRHRKELQDLYNSYAIHKSGIGNVISDSVSDGFGISLDSLFNGDFKTKFSGLLGESFDLSNVGNTFTDWINNAFGFSLGENGEAGKGFGAITGQLENALGGFSNFTDNITNAFDLTKLTDQLPGILTGSIGEVFDLYGIGNKKETEKYEPEPGFTNDASDTGKAYDAATESLMRWFGVDHPYTVELSSGLGDKIDQNQIDSYKRQTAFDNLMSTLKTYLNENNSAESRSKALSDSKEYYKNNKKLIDEYVRIYNSNLSTTEHASGKDIILPSWLTDSYENTANNTKTTADNTKLTDDDIKTNTVQTASSNKEAGETAAEGSKEAGAGVEDSIDQGAKKVEGAILSQGTNKNEKPKFSNMSDVLDFTNGEQNYNKLQNFRAWAIQQGKTSEEVMGYVVEGFDKEWGIKWDAASKQWLFDVDEFIRKIKEDKFNEHSPSEVFREIADFAILGMVKGFKDDEKLLLTTVGGLMDEVANEVENGVMPNSGPILTPIIDDSKYNGRYYMDPRTIRVNDANVSATASSFDRDIPDYSERFTSLENAMLNTNNLISGIIDMLENGSVVNVDVDVKPVPDNIYDSVIKTNYQRFRQSGHNGFLMR